MFLEYDYIMHTLAFKSTGGFAFWYFFFE